MEAGIDGRSTGQRNREDGMRSYKNAFVFRSFYDATDKN